MNNKQLSTTTLVRALEVSDDWNELRAMLEELKHRRDLFNLDPILEIAVDDGQHIAVRRAAVECAGTRNLAFTLNWLQRRANDRFIPARRRARSLDALAALQMPHKTLPVFEQIAQHTDAREVRVQAIALIGRFRNLRSITMLTALAKERDRTIAEAAQQALDRIIESNGGIRETANKMLRFAQGLRRERRHQEAVGILKAARKIDPYNGKLLYELASIA